MESLIHVLVINEIKGCLIGMKRGVLDPRLGVLFGWDETGITISI